MLAEVVFRTVIRYFVVLGLLTSTSVFSWILTSTGIAYADSTTPAAENRDGFDAPRFILYFGTEKAGNGVGSLGSKDLATDALETLNQSSLEFQRIFGIRQKSRVVLRFLSPTDFKKLTKAPDWTSAMFYRGEISIPINPNKGLNSQELNRALRHEYVHAVVAEITNYRSPAWIDEGIAQLLEGQINPLLGPALRSWIRQNPAMKLSALESGFTTLPSDLVPAAYAQSLFATRTLIRQYGFPATVKFLSALGEGKTESEAFVLAFRESEDAFEGRLAKQIRLWADSDQIHP